MIPCNPLYFTWSELHETQTKLVTYILPVCAVTIRVLTQTSKFPARALVALRITYPLRGSLEPVTDSVAQVS